MHSKLSRISAFLCKQKTLKLKKKITVGKYKKVVGVVSIRRRQSKRRSRQNQALNRGNLE